MSSSEDPLIIINQWINSSDVSVNPKYSQILAIDFNHNVYLTDHPPAEGLFLILPEGLEIGEILQVYASRLTAIDEELDEVWARAEDITDSAQPDVEYSISITLIQSKFKVELLPGKNVTFILADTKDANPVSFLIFFPPIYFTKEQIDKAMAKAQAFSFQMGKAADYESTITIDL